MVDESKKFLIKDTRNDKGEVPSPDYYATYSPDIICYQNYVLAYSDAVSSYDRYICKTFLQKTINNVYIRAKNNTDIDQNGEVKAFYSSLTLLYMPNLWKPLLTASKKDTLKLVAEQKEVAKVGDIVLSSEAFLLMEVEDPSQHYCMMALSRAENGEWLVLPEKFDGDVGLWNFLRNHPEIAYNNIVIESTYLHQHSEIVTLGNLNALIQMHSWVVLYFCSWIMKTN